MKKFNEIKKYLVLIKFNNTQKNLTFINEYEMMLYKVNKYSYYIKFRKFNNSEELLTDVSIDEETLKNYNDYEILQQLANFSLIEYNQKYYNLNYNIIKLDVFSID